MNEADLHRLLSLDDKGRRRASAFVRDELPLDVLDGSCFRTVRVASAMSPLDACATLACALANGGNSRALAVLAPGKVPTRLADALARAAGRLRSSLNAEAAATVRVGRLTPASEPSRACARSVIRLIEDARMARAAAAAGTLVIDLTGTLEIDSGAVVSVSDAVEAAGDTFVVAPSTGPWTACQASPRPGIVTFGDVATAALRVNEWRATAHVVIRLPDGGFSAHPSARASHKWGLLPLHFTPGHDDEVAMAVADVMDYMPDTGAVLAGLAADAAERAGLLSSRRLHPGAEGVTHLRRPGPGPLAWRTPPECSSPVLVP